jgi:hypothetical protein
MISMKNAQAIPKQMNPIIVFIPPLSLTTLRKATHSVNPSS